MAKHVQWWRSGSFRRDAEKALALSAAMYLVPCSTALPPFPLGALMAMAPVALYQAWETYALSLALKMFGFVVGWNLLLAGIHFLRIRSGGWTGRFLLAPIILLTAGPLYWVLWIEGPPSPEDIAATRKPEHGDWEEVCRIEGLYYVAKTSPAATQRGEIWIGRRAKSGDPIERYKLRLETACSLELIEAIPKTARLLAGHVGRRAVYFRLFWVPSG